MSPIVIARDLLAQIHLHGESSYPEEGAGFLLGTQDRVKRVHSIMGLANAQASSRATRYLIEPADYLRAEAAAEDSGWAVLGVFHSHPDHPDEPSEHDREWAQPNFSYVITRVDSGKAVRSRSWVLAEDRSGFVEEPIGS